MDYLQNCLSCNIMNEDFYEKTLKTLKANGVHTFVVSNSITTAKYAQLLQDWILKNYQVKSIDYFNNIKTFDAGVIPVITIIQNTKSLTKTVHSHLLCL